MSHAHITGLRSSLLICAAVFATAVFRVGSASGDDMLPPGVTALGSLTIPNSERFSIQSKKVGKPFIVDVTRIGSQFGAPPGGKVPVVFVTDNDSFPALVPALASGSPGSLFPPMIIVGIGYDTTGAKEPLGPLAEIGLRRSEDFTPSKDKTYNPFMPMALQLFERAGMPAPEPQLGRADIFLAFINEELKPFIAARYPANIGDSTLVGHSMGGLFAAHVLFTSSASFHRYIILSPAAQYDNGILFSEEKARGDIAARVFMGVGGEDVPVILESTPRLDAQIRVHSRPSLRYAYKLFPGENHLSMFSVGVMAGLRAVFDPLAPPGAPAPAAPSAAKP
jgi:uncharacterized protein